MHCFDSATTQQPTGPDPIMPTPREQDILRLTVQAHAISGRAVSSRVVSDRCGYDLSPATIRSVMSDLERQGLLFRPHASSGCIPTEAGYRSYADEAIQGITLPEGVRKRIRRACQKGDGDVERTLDGVSRAVAAIIPYACLVMPPSFEQATVREIRLMRLDDASNQQGTKSRGGRVLALLVSPSGQVVSRIFKEQAGYSQEQLNAFARALSQRLQGLTLKQGRERLKRELATIEQDYRRLCDSLLTMMREAALQSGALIINGRMNLITGGQMTADEAERVRMGEMLHLLEEQRQLMALLNSCLDADGVRLFIGSEMLRDSDAQCSVIASKFQGPESHLSGTVGVLGPTHLNYEQVIPLVDYTARFLSGFLAESSDDVHS